MATIIAEATEASRRAFDPQNLERMSDNLDSESSLSSPPGGVTTAPRSVTEMEAVAIRQRRARVRDHCDKWAAAIYDCAIKVSVFVLTSQTCPISGSKDLDLLSFVCVCDVGRYGTFSVCYKRRSMQRPMNGSLMSSYNQVNTHVKHCLYIPRSPLMY